MSPRFSIVIPHYDLAVSDDELLRCLRSLSSQTFRNFEVLLFHDGPPSRPLPSAPADVPHFAARVTAARMNDFGHSLRDVGIRMARGDYIVHLNADNLLYPNALAELDRASRDEEIETVATGVRTNPDLLVFPIAMIGVVGTATGHYLRTRNPNHRIVITGCPPMPGNIDCMQLVMRRSQWLAVGGWYDKSVNSDGVMYPQLLEKYGGRMIGQVLGEHW